MAIFMHLALATMAILGSPSTGHNSVSGTVIDWSGKPVEAATVMLELSPMGGVFPTVLSDENGHFEFKDIEDVPRSPSGWLPQLSASKPSDYLMDPESFKLGFATGGRVPRFVLNGSQHVENQIIQFGPPGGRLVLRFKDRKVRRVSVKIQIARKGEKPPKWMSERMPLPVAFPLDTLIPGGIYEVTVFTVDGEYIDKIEVKVEQQKDTEALLSLPEGVGQR